MQIGVIGLGRMGANIVRRLQRGQHRCVAYDADVATVRKLASEGATGADSLTDLVTKLEAPRAVWVMLPAGAATEETIDKLAALLSPDDVVIDGGNTFYQDDVRRAKALATKRIHHLDVGTSGGVWGLERGYCLMIGGKREVAEQLDPIFATLAPGDDGVARTPGRETHDRRAERGYVYCGPHGAGHFVKMIHNGIEYGLMQAYAEGFDILRNAAKADIPAERRYEFDLADIAEVWRHGSVVSSWLLDLTAAALAENRESVELFRRGGGFRRGSMDRKRRGGRGGASRRAHRGPLHPLPFTTGSYVRRKNPLRHATQIRRARRADKENMTIVVHDDAEALSQAAACWLTERALAAQTRFAVSLAGGSTPRRMYELLASVERERFPWSRVHWFFGDERSVPHDHPDSNFRMVSDAMLSKAPVPGESIHPIPFLESPELAANAYERALKNYYGAEKIDPQRPLFDAVLLGLGDDGHTASLFPGTLVLNERSRWAAPVVGAMPQPRITITYPALESSRAVAFLVSGAGKREALRRVWRGDDLPAARLRPQGELIWFIDRAADPRSA